MKFKALSCAALAIAVLTSAIPSMAASHRHVSSAEAYRHHQWEVGNARATQIKRERAQYRHHQWEVGKARAIQIRRERAQYQHHRWEVGKARAMAHHHH